MSEEKKRRGRPKKSVLDQAVVVRYERSTSDDPKEQSLIDLMEMGRSVVEFSKNGIRRIDPLGPEAEVALYNLEHRNQLMQTATMSTEELKAKFPEAVKDLPHLIGRKPGVSIDVEKIRKKIIGATKGEEEIPFPENWAAMGKVDKLKWLTANRK